MKLKAFALTFTSLAAAMVAHAQIASLGLEDISSPTVSPGSDINGATTYNIGDLASFSNASGFLINLPTQNYGPATFEPGIGNSFSFGSAVFGNFTSTSITVAASTVGFESIQILGHYTSGSIDGDAIMNVPASVDLSFTQNPISIGGFSDSGEFSVLLPVVPEPSTLAMAGVGMGVLGLLMRLRLRKACHYPLSLSRANA